jgi:hypothetical protein
MDDADEVWSQGLYSLPFRYGSPSEAGGDESPMNIVEAAG